MIHPNELPDGYDLIEILGHGGNAKVARVRHGGQEHALKLLGNYRDPDSPTYKRFVNEVLALQQLHEDAGVMPMVDHNLPDSPSKTDRPWFTMPVATPIVKALGVSPSLSSCVDAVGDVANTLVRLKEQDIGHRDIKPDNLFQLSDNWVIGDFGLATFPNSIEGVTEQEGRPLGSRHFMAPEMSTDAINASPFPADVWSLAKTLWSLATGNRHPSYLPFDQSTEGLAAYGVDDPRTHLIDRLLESGTARGPDDRIQMEDFANELRQWLMLADQPRTELDVGDLAAAKQTLILPIVDGRKEKTASIEAATEVMNALGPRITEMRESLAKEYGDGVADTGYVDQVSFGNAGFTFQFCDFKKRDGLACYEARFTVNATSPATYQLRFSVLIQVMPDLQHRLCAVLSTNANGKGETFWEDQCTVPYGTSQELASLNELCDRMTQQVRPALKRLNDLIVAGAAG